MRTCRKVAKVVFIRAKSEKEREKKTPKRTANKIKTNNSDGEVDDHR